MSGPVVLCIDAVSYATALAACEIAAKRADVLKAPDVAARFRSAIEDLQRAYMHALMHEVEVAPSIIEKQS